MNAKTQTRRPVLVPRRRGILSRRPRQHDPMLVLNMSAFNFEKGWSRILNPVKTYENAP